MNALNNKIKKHISLTSCSQINQVYTSFSEELQLNYLNVIRKYEDGSVFYLCSNQSWLENYIGKNYPALGAFEHHPEYADLKYVLWTGMPDDPVFKDTRNMFDTIYGVTITRKHKGFCDYFNFGSLAKDSSILNLYVNKFDLFEKAIDYFYDKTGKLIEQADKNRLVIPDDIKKELILQSDLQAQLETDSLADTSKYKRHYIGDSHKGEYLTERELECIRLAVIGKSAIEISMILNVSRRTVEAHLDNVKSKFNCYKQMQLGYMIGKLGIE